MNRRTFLRQSAGAIAGTALGLGYTGRAGAQAAQAAGARPPNIVVIMADDMGFSDLGCYGSEIATPNLDRLAGEGLRFSQAYNSARCCPTRAALLTGLHPHQAGMGGMVVQPDKMGPEGPYQGYLSRQCVTFAEALKSAGYRSYMSGKWHVGEAPEHWPRQRGFDRYFGLISGASSYFEILTEERPRVMALDDTPYTPEGDRFYMTDAFTEYAVRYIEEHPTEVAPFCLYLSYTAPHWPLHAWPEDIEKYRGRYRIGWDEIRRQRYQRLLELGLIDPKWPLSPRDETVPPWEDVEDKDHWDLLMAVYAAMIDRMDQGIGKVLDALRRTGAEENTLVIFLADNGGCHENIDGRRLHQPGTKAGERGSYVAYDRPWANASNTPFRLFKHWVHEGGIATPLIARWPERIRAQGEITHQPMYVTDLMATMLDAAGSSYPAEYAGNSITPLEGKSLLPIFDGKTRQPHERLYWEHMKNRAVREDNMKLVATKSGSWELYDLDAGRTECNNLIDRFPQKAQELNHAWENWAKRCGVEFKPA